jgi:hypothetical protein
LKSTGAKTSLSELTSARHLYQILDREEDRNVIEAVEGQVMSDFDQPELKGRLTVVSSPSQWSRLIAGRGSPSWLAQSAAQSQAGLFQTD